MKLLILTALTTHLGPENYAGNPPVRPVLCEGNWVFKASLLFWDADEDGLDFTIKNDSPVALINPTSSDVEQINALGLAKFERPHSKWEFGYQVGAEYTSYCNTFDFALLWTDFKDRSRKVVRSLPSVNALVALWSAFTPAQGGPLFAREVEGTRKFHLNLFDLPMGRKFWVSRRLNIHPFLGLRYTRLSQDLNLLFLGGSWSPRVSPDQLPFRDQVLLDNIFKGVGLRSGLDTSWHIDGGFNFYGTVAASLIYGHFKLRQNESILLFMPPQTPQEILATKDRFHASRAILDLAFGLEWTKQFFDCTFAVTTRIGWEQHLFFHQLQLWKVLNYGAKRQNFPNLSGQNVFTQARGTFSTEGLTLSCVFSF